MPLFTAKCDDSVRIVDYPETNPRSSLRDFISILVVDPAMNRWAKLGRPSDFVVRFRLCRAGWPSFALPQLWLPHPSRFVKSRDILYILSPDILYISGEE